MGVAKDLELKLASTTFGAWLAKSFSSRLDPFLFRLTRGRFTTLGPVVIPQLVLTTTGRKSGQPRDAQLVYTEIDDGIYIVASNFGGQKHPAWSHNLTANPEATVLIRGSAFEVVARQLSESEKQEKWDLLVANIPNYDVYKTRTERNFKVYQLVPKTPADKP